ncbi:MAG: hypothetical protein LBV52_00015 [Spirochaetaceae bacterium]|jgi:hypothetical protein|nr:hypothetical protein [Spirochaetaceae bacterium]
MRKNNDPHDLFDLIFKRLMHLSKIAVINFINGLFKTNHPLTSKVEYLATEYVDNKLRKTLKDMMVCINGKRYMIEFQRRKDKRMALRILIYCYYDALSTQSVNENDVIVLRSPQAAIICLENTGKTSENILLYYQDGTEHTFTVPVFNLPAYSLAELEDQNMQLLLPFYITTLQDKVKKAKTSEERRSLNSEIIALLKEIERASDQAVSNGILESEDARVIIELLDRVNHRLFGSYDELQEANKMSEQILELRTDKIVRDMELRTDKILQEAEQKYQQKAAREKQAIAAFLRANGTPDDLISRAFNIQTK